MFENYFISKFTIPNYPKEELTMKINLVPKTKRKISKFNNDPAKKLGFSLSNLTGKSMKRQGSSKGGKMVKRMVEKCKKLF